MVERHVALTKSDLSLITSARYIELLGVVKDELDKLKADLETKHIKFELIAGVVIIRWWCYRLKT